MDESGVWAGRRWTGRSLKEIRRKNREVAVACAAARMAEAIPLHISLLSS